MQLILTGLFDTKEAEEVKCDILYPTANEIETDFLKYNLHKIITESWISFGLISPHLFRTKVLVLLLN